MIITIEQLKQQYQDYVDIPGKISREIKLGKLFPLVKGVYETDGTVCGAKLTQFIYGPSYLSFDYVLYKQGLIPETVYNTFTCATFNKRRIKTYNNHFGTFIYRDVPKNVFSLGVVAVQDGNYTYLEATPEKALCDKLYTVSPVLSIKNLKNLLFEDLRIDEEKFNELNKEDLLKLAPLYHSTNLIFLAKFIKRK